MYIRRGGKRRDPVRGQNASWGRPLPSPCTCFPSTLAARHGGSLGDLQEVPPRLLRFSCCRARSPPSGAHSHPRPRPQGYLHSSGQFTRFFLAHLVSLLSSLCLMLSFQLVRGHTEDLTVSLFG